MSGRKSSGFWMDEGRFAPKGTRFNAFLLKGQKNSQRPDELIIKNINQGNGKNPPSSEGGFLSR
jgi:hypothetical protein